MIDSNIKLLTFLSNRLTLSLRDTVQSQLQVLLRVLLQVQLRAQLIIPNHTRSVAVRRFTATSGSMRVFVHSLRWDVSTVMRCLWIVRPSSSLASTMVCQHGTVVRTTLTLSHRRLSQLSQLSQLSLVQQDHQTVSRVLGAVWRQVSPRRVTIRKARPCSLIPATLVSSSAIKFLILC